MVDAPHGRVGWLAGNLAAQQERAKPSGLRSAKMAYEHAAMKKRQQRQRMACRECGTNGGARLTMHLHAGQMTSLMVLSPECGCSKAFAFARTGLWQKC